MAVKTYDLLDPITLKAIGPKGEVVREEELKAFELDFPDDGILRAKHLRVVDEADGFVAGQIAMIAFFANQPVKVIDECSSRDFMALYQLVEGFQQPGGQTGETS